MTDELASVIPLRRRTAASQAASPSVAVVAPQLSRWYVGQAVVGMDEVLHHAGFDLLIIQLGYGADEQRLETLAGLVARRQVVGVVVLGVELTAEERGTVDSLAVPVVVVGFEDERWASVGIDEVAAATAAVNHLLGLGHRRIGFIGGELDEPTHPAATARRRGYRLALLAAGLMPDRRLQNLGSDTVAGGHAAMVVLLSVTPRPTAVFVQSDEMAFGALSALREAGMHCPGDMSIVGFGDHETAALLELTTVAQPVAEQGRLAVKRLLGAVAGAPSEGAALLPTRLVIRGTTAPPR